MDFISEYPLWALVTLGVAAFAWLLGMVVWLAVYLRPVRRARRDARVAAAAADAPQEVQPQGQPHVTVVVYAHNQADALLRNLPVIFGQDYPHYDVVVVDDASSDETADVLTMMEQRSERFSHTLIRDGVRNISRRKLAMMLGVKAAPGDLVIMTAAQCVPASSHWVAAMVERFVDRVDVVLGPVAYENRAGLVSRFCCYDLLQREIALFGLTLSGWPYAGWATNMAFRREVFFANGSHAFRKHLNLRPGEDDLFVGEVARLRPRNVDVACTADALLVSQQSPLVEGWTQERKDRAFTSIYYRTWPKTVRRLEVASRYLTVAGLLGLAGYAVWTLPAVGGGLSQPAAWTLMSVALALLLAYWLTMALTVKAVCRVFGLRRFFWSPVVYGLYTPLVDLRFALFARLNRKLFCVTRIS